MEPLTPAEARVVSSLVEKQRTVPDTYPLTLNALLAACNQSTNRDPVLHLDEGAVLAAVDSLKARGMARIVHPSTGIRSTKYRHVLDEALSVEADRLSVLAVLLLRGPQTVAELRTRTERLHAFDSVADIETALEGLAEAGHAERLERRPGEREVRWRQLLADTGYTEVDRPAPALTSARNDHDPGLRERVTALEAEVAELRSVVDRLREVLD